MPLASLTTNNRHCALPRASFIIPTRLLSYVQKLIVVFFEKMVYLTGKTIIFAELKATDFTIAFNTGGQVNCVLSFFNVFQKLLLC